MSRTTNIPVVGIILRQANEILFVMRKNTGWMDGKYGLPGGHVAANETFRQAACREVAEELGLSIQPDQLKYLMTFHKGTEAGGDVRVGTIFELVNWEGNPQNAEPHVHDHIAWLDSENLPDNVIPEISFKLQQIGEGVNYLEYDWGSNSINS